jgi:large subunit ribosomal protein L28
MARVCDVCGKGTVFGNNVSHSHKKTRRQWKANIVSMRVVQGSSVKKIKICTRCLRSDKVKKAF